jgi:hypothetical protein
MFISICKSARLNYFLKSFAAFVVGVGLTVFVADDPEITDFALTRFTLFLLI